MADRVAGGLVAGDRKQDEERPELLWCELVAVDLGVHQGRRDVIGRMGAPVLSEGLGVGEDLEGDLHESLVGATELGVARAEDGVGPVEDPLVVLRGDAHHRADDLEGERSGELLDEVGRTRWVALDHPIEDLGGLGAHRRLEFGDVTGGEALRDDRSEPEVLRIVHVDHRPVELVELLWEVDDVRALARAEELGVATGLPDVVVSGDRVVAGSGREGGSLEESLGVLGKARCRAELGEARLALVARGCPELHRRDVRQAHGWVEGDLGHALRVGVA